MFLARKWWVRSRDWNLSTFGKYMRQLIDRRFKCVLLFFSIKRHMDGFVLIKICLTFLFPSNDMWIDLLWNCVKSMENKNITKMATGRVFGASIFPWTIGFGPSYRTNIFVMDLG